MICSACRQARQQLLLARRVALPPAAPAASATIARRGLAAAHTPMGTRPRHATATRPFSQSAAAPSLAASSSAVPAAPAAAAAAAAAAPAKPDFLDEAESHIWDLLVAALEPAELSVRDISGGCGSMYGIEISSDKFRGANMLKQQRMVNAALGDLVKSWHGVQLKTRVP